MLGGTSGSWSQRAHHPSSHSTGRVSWAPQTQRGCLAVLALCLCFLRAVWRTGADWLAPSPLNTVAPFSWFWSRAGPVESQLCHLCLSSGQVLGRAPWPTGVTVAPWGPGVNHSFIHPFSRYMLSPTLASCYVGGKVGIGQPTPHGAPRVRGLGGRPWQAR